MIPRIIHQTWKTDQVPEKFRPFSNTWKKYNPDWSYRFWNDRDLLEFVAAHYPSYLDLFCSYPKGVQRADAARYMLLHHFGGLYADMDAECVQSLDALQPETRVILCEEPETHWAQTTTPRGLPIMLFNGVMASPPNHPFWLHLLKRMDETRHASNVLDSTGPCLLTGAVLSYPNPQELRIEGAHFFNPIDTHGNPASDPNADECYAIHHWAGTWWSPAKTGWRQQRVASLARKYYRIKSVLLGGKRLHPPTTRAEVSPEAIAAPIPTGKNIAILVPARDATTHLVGFLKAIDQLNVPKNQLKLVFCEGDSRDGTYERLVQLTEPLRPLYRDIILLRKDTGSRFDASKRWLPSVQRTRRSGLARVRNHLIDHGLDENDDWALWIDVDVWRFPPDILEQLLHADARIVTPNCVIKHGGPSFDTNSSISTLTRYDYRFFRKVKHGLFQPPANDPFRLHLSDLRHSDRVPLDSVGGTMLLVDAALHRGGLRFPELPYDYLIETEAFGRLAKDCGITPIGLPRVEVLHVPW
jgi:hypothetical protein